MGRKGKEKRSFDYAQDDKKEWAVKKERVRKMAEKSIDIAKETSVQAVLTDTASLKQTASTINTNTQSAKTDSSTIKSRMGTASDGTSSTTLFGKINKLLEGSGISIADVKAYLNSTVGTSEEKSLDSLIAEFKNAILTSGAIKSIKSVQRGVTYYKSSKNYYYTDITISEVDTSKCIVLADGATGYNNDSSSFAVSALPTTSFNSNTSLRITSSGNEPYSRGAYGYISWQVIEFY